MCQVGNVAHAAAHFNASLSLHPHPLAARNLATFAPTADAASAHYHRAWALWRSLHTAGADPISAQLGADLAGEIAGWLLLNRRWEELAPFLAALPSPYTTKDRVLHARAGLAVHRKDHATALPLLREHCFPTYGGERSKLIQLWFEAQTLKAIDANGGTPLTTAQQLALRKRFRCDGDRTTQKLDSACVCGPPNLGYAY